MKTRAVLCGMFIMGAASLDAGGRLAIRVSPTVAFAPANLVVRAMVEADVDNRAIEIVAESDDFYRSSEVQLDGDDAPRTTISNSAASRAGRMKFGPRCSAPAINRSHTCARK